ncbi:hypothetical protein S245_025126, partial [Arachis hypogaea]
FFVKCILVEGDNGLIQYSIVLHFGRDADLLTAMLMVQARRLNGGGCCTIFECGFG